jgi:epoxide hydrolase 4
VPELFLQADDFATVTDLLRKKPLGLVYKDAVTNDDIEVIKYTFSQPGRASSSNMSHRSICVGTTQAAINYYRALLRYQLDFSRSIVPAPVLLLWGCQDAILGEELAQASCKYCSDVRLKKISNASHWINQDVPEMVNKHIELFLQEIPSVDDPFD